MDLNKQSFRLFCRCGTVMEPFVSAGNGAYVCTRCKNSIRLAADRPYGPQGCRLKDKDTQRICNRPKLPRFPVCENHAFQIAHTFLSRPELVAELVDESVAHEYGVARQKRIEADRVAEDQRRASLREKRKQVGCTTQVVYYVRLSEWNIKIGTTSWLPGRMSDLRVVRREDVLAAEPGSYALESERHRMFDHLRWDPRKEDFKPDPELMEYIAQVRAEHGPPFELFGTLLAKQKASTLKSA